MDDVAAFPTHVFFDIPELHRFAALADTRMAADYHVGFLSLGHDLERLIFESGLLQGIACHELDAVAGDRHRDSPLWEPDHILVASGRGW